MTRRTCRLSFTATCCASAAVLTAAASRSVTAIITAYAVAGLSAVIVAALAIHAGWLAMRRRTRLPLDDLASALVCEPCNGGTGPCACTARCTSRACVGDHTSPATWTPAELGWLRGDKEIPR